MTISRTLLAMAPLLLIAIPGAPGGPAAHVAALPEPESLLSARKRTARPRLDLGLGRAWSWNWNRLISVGFLGCFAVALGQAGHGTPLELDRGACARGVMLSLAISMQNSRPTQELERGACLGACLLGTRSFSLRVVRAPAARVLVLPDNNTGCFSCAVTGISSRIRQRAT